MALHGVGVVPVTWPCMHTTQATSWNILKVGVEFFFSYSPLGLTSSLTSSGFSGSPERCPESGGGDGGLRIAGCGLWVYFGTTIGGSGIALHHVILAIHCVDSFQDRLLPCQRHSHWLIAETLRKTMQLGPRVRPSRHRHKRSETGPSARVNAWSASTTWSNLYSNQLDGKSQKDFPGQATILNRHTP
jgi:hypothetical protein